MQPDPTPVARLDYSTQQERIPRWVLRGFAYGAIVFGLLDFITHAAAVAARIISSSSFSLVSWRDVTGLILTIGHVLASMTLVVSAVGLLRSEGWSRKGAIIASCFIVGMIIINLAMVMLNVMRRDPLMASAVIGYWTGLYLLPAVYPAMLIWFLTRTPLKTLFNQH